MNIKRGLTIVALCLLAGCVGPQLNGHMLGFLDKGMSPQTVKAKFQQEPLAVQTGKSGNRVVEFQRYMMANGVQVDTYILAFENDKLLYWGYVSEFRRLNDQGLNAALNDALPKLFKTN